MLIYALVGGMLALEVHVAADLFTWFFFVLNMI